jgi:hypothetical protein
MRLKYNPMPILLNIMFILTGKLTAKRKCCQARAPVSYSLLT